MSGTNIIGIDVTKRSAQLHCARTDGSVVFRKKLPLGMLLAFVAQQPQCTVAMEACEAGHEWGREFEKLGHDVRLIPPDHVRPLIKCETKDAAEAIVVAALRPTMLFVTLRPEEQLAPIIPSEEPITAHPVKTFSSKPSELSLRTRLCQLARECAETTLGRK